METSPEIPQASDRELREALEKKGVPKHIMLEIDRLKENQSTKGPISVEYTEDDAGIIRTITVKNREDEIVLFEDVHPQPPAKQRRSEFTGKQTWPESELAGNPSKLSE